MSAIYTKGLPQPQKKPQFDVRLPPIGLSHDPVDQEVDRDVEGKRIYENPNTTHAERSGIKTSRRQGEERQTRRIFPSIIKALGAIIAGGASVVSLVNSYEWFVALRPMVVAGLMSATMVGASVLLPDFGIMLLRERKRAMGVLIILAGVLATGFSMVTTMAAIYNGHTWSVNNAEQSAKDSAQADSRLEDAVRERDRLSESIEQTNISIRDTQNKIAALSADLTLSPVAQTLQRRLDSFNKNIKELNSQHSTIVSKIEQLRSTPRDGAAKSRVDFYGFVSSVIHAESSSIEFWTAIIPAVFLEIVAPIMLAVIVFL